MFSNLKTVTYNNKNYFYHLDRTAVRSKVASAPRRKKSKISIKRKAQKPYKRGALRKPKTQKLKKRTILKIRTRRRRARRSLEEENNTGGEMKPKRIYTYRKAKVEKKITPQNVKTNDKSPESLWTLQRKSVKMTPQTSDWADISHVVNKELMNDVIDAQHGTSKQRVAVTDATNQPSGEMENVKEATTLKEKSNIKDPYHFFVLQQSHFG